MSEALFLEVFIGTLVVPLVAALAIFCVYLVGVYFEAERWKDLFLFLTLICLGIALIGEARHNLDWSLNRAEVWLADKPFPWLVGVSWQDLYCYLWPWLLVASALVIGAGLFLWERTRGDYLPEVLIGLGAVGIALCLEFLSLAITYVPPQFANVKGGWDFGPGSPTPLPAYWFAYIYTNEIMALLGCVFVALSLWRLAHVIRVD